MSEHQRDERPEGERPAEEPDDVAEDAGDPEMPDHPLGVDPDEPVHDLPGFPTEDPTHG